MGHEQENEGEKSKHRHKGKPHAKQEEKSEADEEAQDQWTQKAESARSGLAERPKREAEGTQIPKRVRGQSKE